MSTHASRIDLFIPLSRASSTKRRRAALLGGFSDTLLDYTLQLGVACNDATTHASCYRPAGQFLSCRSCLRRRQIENQDQRLIPTFLRAASARTRIARLQHVSAH